MKINSLILVLAFNVILVAVVQAEESGIKFKDKLELGSAEEDIYSVFPKENTLKIYNPMHGQIFIDAIGNGQINAGEDFFKDDANIMTPRIGYSFFLHDKRIYKIEVTRQTDSGHLNENLNEINIATIERLRELLGKSGRLEINKDEGFALFKTDKLIVDYKYSAFESKFILIDVIRASVSESERAKFNSETNKKKAGF